MSEMTISIENKKTGYLPGEELRGSIEWDLPQEAKKVELILFWYTAGEGNRETEIVHEQDFDVTRQKDRHDFKIRLPEAPYSFSGKLFSISWCLELSSDTDKKAVREEIVISHTGDKIIL